MAMNLAVAATRGHPSPVICRSWPLIKHIAVAAASLPTRQPPRFDSGGDELDGAGQRRVIGGPGVNTLDGGTGSHALIP